MHKIFLLAAMMVVALAFAAPATFAQHEAVEVVEEPSGHHCGNPEGPMFNPCLIHITGEGTYDLMQHTAVPSEVVFGGCLLEFEASIDESGGVTILAGDVELSGATCGRQPCPGVNWVGDIEEVGGSKDLDLAMCLEPVGGGTDTSCTLSGLSVTGSSHDYEIIAVERPCTNLGGVIEFTGEWHLEEIPAAPHEEVEIIH